MSWRPDLTREQRLELLLRRVKNDPYAYAQISKPLRKRIASELTLDTLTKAPSNEIL